MGRYRLLTRLGTGGMAEIFLAAAGELPGYRTLVVLKRILPRFAHERHFVRMFLDECRIAARLHHPNVVRVLEIGRDGDQYFLAMELVKGKSLSALLRKVINRNRPLPPTLAAFVGAQAASGLGYVHSFSDAHCRAQKIVHRDVSPGNVLISFEGVVKVIDFGIAHALGRRTHTDPGQVKGKLPYMSPEQALESPVDARSDIFSLGATLWEALVGRPLFYRANRLATWRALMDEPIRRPSELVSVPPALEAIVMRALERNPARRFQAAQDMRRALERFVFQQAGFSPQQVAHYMKLMFADEVQQWRRAAGTAAELRRDTHRAQTPGGLR